MRFSEFKNLLDNGEDFCVCLFEGEDAFFRERGLTLLKDKFLQESSINLACFENLTEITDDFISSVSAYPFMSAKRFTVVREFYPKAEMLKGEIKDYLDNPYKQNLLIIVNEKKCEALKKFKKISVIDCGKADKSLLVKWIKAECNKNNVSIDFETAGLIVEYCLSDMTRISNEVSKIVAYVGNGGTVGSDVVNSMVSRDTEYKIYEMTDYISKKQFDSAISVIKDMLNKGETPQRILVSVYNYFRRLLHAAISGKSPQELAERFKIMDYAAKKLTEQAVRFKKRALKNAVDTLVEYDFRIKSGTLDEFEALFNGVFRIMTSI